MPNPTNQPPVTTAISDRQLNEHLRNQPTVSPEKQRNLDKAVHDLAAIISLQENPDFRWFWKESVAKEYGEARDAYMSPDTKRDELADARVRYLTAKTIYGFLMTQERDMRRAINVNDPEVPRLSEKIALL